MKHIYSVGRFIVFSILVTGFVSLPAQETDRKAYLKAIQHADMYYYYDQNYLRASTSVSLL
jgi:hypothetical protein